jgi:RHS repeat-associated protein
VQASLWQRALRWVLALAGQEVETSSVASVRLLFLHTDHLGAPRLGTDLKRRVVWSAAYEAFGRAVVSEDPDGDGEAVRIDLRLPGQVFDAEMGTHYNYFRDYDPGVGRYLQFDPTGLSGGLNGYTYVDNSPMMFTDPKGLVKWTGEMYGVTAINLGGGAQFWFDLKSECVNDKYAYIRVYASALGVGLGVKYTATASSISFDDHLSEIHPEGFAGSFKMASAGFGAILVGSYSAVQLGNNTADFSAEPTPGIGVDASVSGLVGSSMLVSKDVKACKC